jgi:hypothetical protein
LNELNDTHVDVDIVVDNCTFKIKVNAIMDSSSKRMMRVRALELIEREECGVPWDEEEDRRWFERYRKKQAEEAAKTKTKTKGKTKKKVSWEDEG